MPTSRPRHSSRASCTLVCHLSSASANRESGGHSLRLRVPPGHRDQRTPNDLPSTAVVTRFVFSGLRRGRPGAHAVVHGIKAVAVNEAANYRKRDTSRIRLRLRAFIRNTARLFTDDPLALLARPGTGTTEEVRPAAPADVARLFRCGARHLESPAIMVGKALRREGADCVR